MKPIEIEYNDCETETFQSVDNLYDLSWNNYRDIEQQIEGNIAVDSDGNVEALDVGSEQVGDMIVNLQEAIANAVLQQNDCDVTDVKASSVKTIFSEYSEDIEDLGLKLKKK